MTEQALTYQTRISLDGEQILADYAALMNKVQHSLFAKLTQGDLKKQKSLFQNKFNITARQFNAVRVQLEGKIESIKQINRLRIKTIEETIERVEKQIKTGKDKQKIHGKKIRLGRLRSKLNQLTADQQQNKIRLCFGTKKLFKSQFQEGVDHGEWKKEWEFERSREFFTLGSKDEASGNQTCTATIQEDGALSLRLRLPDALNRGKYLHIPNVRFQYGHDIIAQAVKSNLLRSALLKEGDPEAKNYGQAISYRFVLDKKGWRIFATTTLPKITQISDHRIGAIGIDINVDHLAITETDRFGNPISSESIPLNLYGKSKNQAKALIGDAAAKIVAKALHVKKPLVIEKLDFTKKRQTLRELTPKLARMLSSFSYSAILQSLRSRSYRLGIQIFEVNPAFTSLLGRLKFAKRYGISIHQAAALCIARRFYQFSEKLPSCLSAPDGKGGHISFSVPARNRKKKEWSYLREVAGKFRAALAGHFRATLSRTGDPLKTIACVGNPRKLPVESRQANR